MGVTHQKPQPASPWVSSDSSPPSPHGPVCSLRVSLIPTSWVTLQPVEEQRPSSSRTQTETQEELSPACPGLRAAFCRWKGLKATGVWGEVRGGVEAVRPPATRPQGPGSHRRSLDQVTGSLRSSLHPSPHRPALGPGT